MRSDRLATAHGEVVLVALDAEHALHPDERAHTAALSPHRLREWVAGRAALRELLPEAGALLADDRGAPRVPRGFVASVSHKGAWAAALVAVDDGARIGLDLELAAPSRLDIAPRILTAREQAMVRDPRDVTRAFSIKEAIYKAIDPFLRRYVGFQEVELDVHADGTVTVTSSLGLAIEATWREHAGHWLSTARGQPLLSQLSSRKPL